MDTELIVEKSKEKFNIEIGPNLCKVLIEMERHVCSSNAYVKEVNALFSNLKELMLFKNKTV